MTTQAKAIVIAAVIVILVAGGVFFYTSQQASAPGTEGTPAVTPAPAATPTATVTPSPTPSVSGQPRPTTTPAKTPSPAPTPGGITMAQVATHNNASSCWTVIRGTVYNLTTWINQHPGGAQAILQLCGKDGTAAFEAQHGNDPRAKSVLAGFTVGVLAS